MMKSSVLPSVLCIAGSLLFLTRYASEVEHWSPSNAYSKGLSFRKRFQHEIVKKTKLPQLAAKTESAQVVFRDWNAEQIDSRIEDDRPRPHIIIPPTDSSGKVARGNLALDGLGPGRSQAAGAKNISSCRPDQLVYIYDLSPEFNVATVTTDCATNRFWAVHPRNACQIYSPEHWGIGPPLKDEKFAELGSDPQMWADTGQHALEVMFHQYMTNLYPCRTHDSEAAAAFYVPLYTGILWQIHSAQCATNNCPQPSPLLGLGNRLEETLKRMPYLERNEGRDHFTTMGYVTDLAVEDFTCCKSKLLNMAYTRAMTLLGIEPAYAHEERQVSIPYPTSFHPVSLSDIAAHQTLVASSHRPIFVSFAGSFKRPGLHSGRALRGALQEHCARAPDFCHVAACENVCGAAESFELYLRSTFCLQPPGDSPTRRGVFDALQAGCIPVIFQPKTINPYAHFLRPDWGRYSVFVPEDDVINGATDVIEFLRNVSDVEIEAKRKRIVKVLPRIVYRNVARTLLGKMDVAGSDYQGPVIGWTGAYEVAIDAALEKIRDRMQTRNASNAATETV
ncbi:Exostosin family protein [Klebsormidium nitens]|uniref:Exostosin family protein n=1 Tax=Klebsormidium nitens TaxID=105231 RepID=A0A1Y1HRL3_KLENI|nr:Exostosin family protein [Klebsormidium nitens]|eukprot:GAQ79216.1 Exostosin family protein [Klebsormidium nitens]